MDNRTFIYYSAPLNELFTLAIAPADKRCELQLFLNGAPWVDGVYYVGEL